MSNELGKTAICNIALRRIGVSPVNNVDMDTSSPAIEMRAAWPLAVNAVLRSAQWSFAKKIIPLAEIYNEKILGWEKVYSYPKDCVMLWSIEDESSIRNKEIKHKWEKCLSPTTNLQVIACDLPEAYAVYTTKIEDPVMWDEIFVDALAWRLALDTCPRLVSDSGVYQRCTQMYSSTLLTAQTMNKTENGKDEEILGAFINVR